MLFASTAKGGIEEQVECYTVKIKEGITFIQQGSDELEKLTK